MTLQRIASAYSELSTLPIFGPASMTFAEIETSMLFVVAPWSGPSLHALRLVTHHLKGMAEKPTLWICDIDRLPVQQLLLIHQPQGWGEVLWLHGGEVVAACVIHKESDWRLVVEENCARWSAP